MDARRQVGEERLARTKRQGMFGDLTVPGLATWEAGGHDLHEGQRNMWRSLSWVVAAVGLAAFVGWLVYASIANTNYVNSFVGVPTQVGEVVEIPDDGLYTVWTESVDREPLAGRPRASLAFQGPGSEAVEMVPAESTVTYGVDWTREGYAVGTVDFPAAGTYVVTDYELLAADTTLGLGAGESMPHAIASTARTIAGVAIAALLVCVALAWRHHRHHVQQVTDNFSGLKATGRVDA